MAAAHVSGLAALVLGRQPQLEPLQVLGILSQGARDLLTEGWDASSGAGLAQVAAGAPAYPLAVEISSPHTDEVLGDSVAVRAEVRGAGQVHYELSWRSVALPVRWLPLTSGDLEMAGSGSRQLSWSWRTADLPEGAYLLRAMVEAGTVHHSDRTEVTVMRRQPLLADVQVRRLLNGPQWDHVLEWRTDRPSGGVVQIRPATGDGLLWRIPVTPGRLFHHLSMPPDLSPGTYRVEIVPTPGTPVSWTGLIDIGTRGAGGWDLEALGELPNGYLMPQVVDLDGDGLPEIVEMLSGIGVYNTVGFYEMGAGRLFQGVHMTSRTFIPWSAGDVDGDGKQEIVAVDAERVRLLEATSPGLFPSRVAWEQRDVWGGEIGDLDADGRQELYLRSSRSSLFRVHEARGDDSLAEVAVLSNPTTGENELGDRQVIGDLDGDGRGDLLGCDQDGDVFVYESVVDDQLRAVWSQSWDEDEARSCVIGGGADLDGDGEVEFAVARFRRDRFDMREARWQISVFGSPADNAYESEWSVLVQGGKPGGNGIAVGDLDNDGSVELIVATAPDLYVLKGIGASQYQPVWHWEASDPHRPLTADVDGDGRVDLLFSSGGQVRAFSLAAVAAPLPAPADLRARPEGVHGISLEWEAVAGSHSYTVYRGDLGSRALRSGLVSTAYVDCTATPAIAYRYSVAAVDVDGGEGYRASAAAVETEARPRIVQVLQLSRYQLAVHFDTPMGPSASDPYRFSLEPGVGTPTSAVLDHGSSRAVLGFEAPLPDSGRYDLMLMGLRSGRGTPLHEGSSGFSVVLAPVSAMTTPVMVRILSPTEVAVTFSGPVVAQSADRATFELDGGDLLIEAVTAGESDEVILVLAESTPVRPLGRVHELRVHGLRDEEGGLVQGRLVFVLAASELGDVIAYPNPFDPGKGSLTIANLPAGSVVSIADAAGRVIHAVTERDGDGGVDWDGRNATGQRVGSGIYFYQVCHEGGTRTGKLAVIRQ